MANTDGQAITLAELQNVLASLKTQRDTMNTTYKTSIKQVLDSSTECFSVAGLDYSTIMAAFNDTFNTLDKNYDGLINVLENSVIKDYSELTTAIRKMFGDNFGARLSELLGVSAGPSTGGVRTIESPKVKEGVTVEINR
ncbi:MAG: hypothetical protein J6X28_00200 [Bacilli bacterium]|nr:hypothetical protein [Bacilli bacterium]